MGPSRDCAEAWRAIDCFVDREHQLDAFRRVLQTPAGEALSIINPFGGGVRTGKVSSYQRPGGKVDVAHPEVEHLTPAEAAVDEDSQHRAIANRQERVVLLCGRIE